MPFRKSQSQNHPSLKPKAHIEAGGSTKFSFKKGTGRTEKNDDNSQPNDKSFVVSTTQSEVKIVEQKKSAAEIVDKNSVQTAKAAVTAPIQHSPETTEKREGKAKSADKWLARRGHAVTYVLLFAFTFVLYFRPYELIPGLESFSSIALYFALATLAVFLPSKLAAEGS